MIEVAGRADCEVGEGTGVWEDSVADVVAAWKGGCQWCQEGRSDWGKEGVSERTHVSMSVRGLWRAQKR